MYCRPFATKKFLDSTSIHFFSFNVIFEYVSDSYASLRYTHFFEGFILNRVPLLKRLKWRLVGSTNVLFGGVRQSNIDLQVKEDGGVVGKEWMNDIPKYWTNTNSINWLQDEE